MSVLPSLVDVTLNDRWNFTLPSGESKSNQWVLPFPWKNWWPQRREMNNQLSFTALEIQFIKDLVARKSVSKRIISADAGSYGRQPPNLKLRRINKINVYWSSWRSHAITSIHIKKMDSLKGITLVTLHQKKATKFSSVRQKEVLPGYNVATL
jgi:hypothetical protein